MTGTITSNERAAIARVSTGLGAVFVAAARVALHGFAEDDSVSPRALQLGIAQAHIDGLASALQTFDPLQRDRLLDTLPAQIRQVMSRAGR